MGAVDLVIQIESPPSVASALQRVGRAGHQVGEVSRGVLFPKHRGDLAQTAVVGRADAQRRHREAVACPTNPLDVLAQQVVADAGAWTSGTSTSCFALTPRAASYSQLPRTAFDATLDLLSGRYPSEEFAELRPRIVWDRVTGTLSGRPGAQRLAVTSGGTIPDRGLFGVFLVGEKASRVGELDEEMVYESRVGDIFALGATSWRIEDITHDRVLVTPAPGIPGRLPFWKGDTLGRPAELGAAVGAFTRELAALPDREGDRARSASAASTPTPPTNLVTYLAEQREATQVVPSDTQIVVERFRDELGDWRLVVHSPYGTPVHAPWALAINARLRERFDIDGQAVASDDGIVIRIPDTDAEPPTGEVIVFEPDEIEQLVTQEVGGSALFASRFRECAARALLLPRRDPGRRSPLWQQRQRSAQLLEVASQYPSFPIVLEAVRECLQDVYDLPALVALLGRIERREVTVVDVATTDAQPLRPQPALRLRRPVRLRGRLPHRRAPRRRALARPGPARRAARPRRAARAARPRGARRGRGRAAVARPRPARPQRRGASPTCCASLGPLSIDEVRARVGRRAPTSTSWLASLADVRRVVAVRMAGEDRWTAIEDIGRLRDGLGVPVPVGTPDAFTEPPEDPLGDLVSRYARSHGPFTTAEVAARLGLGEAVARQTLQRLADRGRVLEGEFRPSGSGTEWCDAEVLRKLRRRSLARLRQEIEPVTHDAVARFLPAWQRVGGKLRGVDGVVAAIDQLAGCPVPASALEPLVLAARVRDYEPRMLDELTASGEVIWAGHAPLPGSDGWVSLHLADQAHLTLPELECRRARPAPAGRARRARRPAAPGSSASSPTGSARPPTPSSPTALWELVWAGLVTNDTLTPLRALVRSGKPTHRTRRTPPRLRRDGAGCRPAPDRPRPPVAGRVLPERDADPTRRAHARAEHLLERHGVVTRGAVMSERVAGGFAGVYKVLSAFEDTGRCRRGYFIEGLGAAQFGSGRRHRPAAHVLRAGERDRAASRSSSRSPRPTRPTPSAPRSPGPSRRPRARRAPPGPQGRRAGRRSSTARSPSTSSAAAARS